MYVPSNANVGADESTGAIAIVGAALRFPGALDPASFFELTTTGRRMFREFAGAVTRPARDGGGDASPRETGTALRAALLDGYAFPPVPPAGGAASGITGRHRLAAETAAAALAEVPGTCRKASRIGVLIADTPSPGTRQAGDWVRQRLGVNGTPPGGVHCSLRAVAAACAALRSGAYDLMLAGGVATGVDPGWLRRSSAAGALATHDVRVYDAYPSGTLPGEGCGVVVLMRAAEARAAGLPAYAEIAGWHAADRGTAQHAALGPAYLQAGVDPADVQLVEGHGAATAAADLAELSVLSEVIGQYRYSGRGRCALGSVAANIGDTRSAAGIAALLKTALAMTTETIPPATGCVRPNRLLRGTAAPFRLPAAAEPWPAGPVQLAAVNSLGVAPHPDATRSGPVHVVLRRYRDQAHRPGHRRTASAFAG